MRDRVLGQRLDEVAAVLLVLLGESLANVGFGAGWASIATPADIPDLKDPRLLREIEIVHAVDVVRIQPCAGSKNMSQSLSMRLFLLVSRSATSRSR